MDGPLQSPSAKLLVYVDHPSEEEDKRHKAGSSDNIMMVRWLLEERMGISPKDYQIQFTLKCFKPKYALKKKDERLIAIHSCRAHSLEEIQKLQPKSIVSTGSITCEAFFGGAQLKTKAGIKTQAHNKEIGKVWVAYSGSYSVQTPSYTPKLYAVLFMAAKDAGLNPQHNPNFKPFDYKL